MNPILRYYARIDARSLGLFRVGMGAVLLGDLWRRWRWLEDFYTNNGILPNHNHLFNLRKGPGVWSALHAVSTDGEAAFAFAVIAGIYIAFLIGFRTRVFHVLSFVALLSLTARNLLLEGPGNHLGLALLLVTIPLPLGSRFSLDALRSAMGMATEKTPAEIRAYAPATEDVVDDRRTPGWSPVSIGALAVTVQLLLVNLALYLQHNGPSWKAGTALADALEITMLASERGHALRESGMLGALTHVVHYAPALAVVLLLVPVARGPVRIAAAALIALHGLVWATLFNFGLFGWSLVASSALALSAESWNGWTRKFHASRARTVIFDTDCGICGWIAKLLVRLDGPGHLTLQGNDELEHLLRRKGPRGDVEEVELPKGIDAHLTDRTFVAVRPDGTFATEAQGVSEVLRAVPGLRWIGFLVAVPGIQQLVGVAYRLVAKRRHAISAQLGMGTCGIPVRPQAADEDGAARPSLDPTPSPFVRTGRKVTGSVRELLAVVVLASALTQTSQANAIGFKVPESRAVAAVAHWTRTMADWKILSPEPPTESGRVVTDAVLRNDANVDVFTRAKPDFGLDQPFALGELWATYFRNIHLDENEPYVAAFRTYLSRGGPMYELGDVNQRPLGVDAYWISAPAEGGEVTETRITRHGRGGPHAADFAKNARPAFTPRARMNRRKIK